MARQATTTAARASVVPGSRARILSAAAAEFAARGFAGASVDRIARAARVNKAMIYYHFKSKAALYREILRDMFDAVGVAVREVAASASAPEEKIRRFVEAIAEAAEARPHFASMWLREVAEGATRVDDPTLRYAKGVVETLERIVNEGRAAGRFIAVNPLMLHFGIIAPLMLFFASAGVRLRLQRVEMKAAEVTRAQVVTHLQQMALGALEGRLS
jgi:TetR/AcrR family transcriptional regulator